MLEFQVGWGENEGPKGGWGQGGGGEQSGPSGPSGSNWNIQVNQDGPSWGGSESAPNQPGPNPGQPGPQGNWNNQSNGTAAWERGGHQMPQGPPRNSGTDYFNCNFIIYLFYY